MIDKNPLFGVDTSREQSARRVAEMLWDLSEGDLSKVPENYLNSLSFGYSDGTISLLDQLRKVDFSSSGSSEEFYGVVDKLARVDPREWPRPESILSIQSEKLLHLVEPETTDFSEFDWEFSDSDDKSRKMELFFKKVISSVYTDGVSRVTDKNGNPPSEANNFLMAADSKSFSGVFEDSRPNEKSKKFPFQIRENSKGNWEIVY